MGIFGSGKPKRTDRYSLSAEEYIDIALSQVNDIFGKIGSNKPTSGRLNLFSNNVIADDVALPHKHVADTIYERILGTLDRIAREAGDAWIYASYEIRVSVESREGSYATVIVTWSSNRTDTDQRSFGREGR